MWAKRHGCTSQKDSCVLVPTEAAVTDFIANNPHGADDAYWFELWTEQADSGKPQQLGFSAGLLPADGVAAIELRDSNGTTVLAKEDTAQLNKSGQFYLAHYRTETAAKPFYFLVRRQDPTTAFSTNAQWNTNLTIVLGNGQSVAEAVGEKLIAHEQEDFFGDDHILISVRVDGELVIAGHPLGAFDQAQQKSLESLIGTRRYVESMMIKLTEVDDLEDDQTEWKEIPAFGNTKLCSVDRSLTFSWDAPSNSAEPASGLYEFQYNVCHGLPSK